MISDHCQAVLQTHCSLPYITYVTEMIVHLFTTPIIKARKEKKIIILVYLISDLSFEYIYNDRLWKNYYSGRFLGISKGTVFS